MKICEMIYLSYLMALLPATAIKRPFTSFTFSCGGTSWVGNSIVTRKHPLFLEDLHFKQKQETTIIHLVMSTSFQNITFQAGYVHITVLVKTAYFDHNYLQWTSSYKAMYFMFEKLQCRYLPGFMTFTVCVSTGRLPVLYLTLALCICCEKLLIINTVYCFFLLFCSDNRQGFSWSCRGRDATFSQNFPWSVRWTGRAGIYKGSSKASRIWNPLLQSTETDVVHRRSKGEYFLNEY